MQKLRFYILVCFVLDAGAAPTISPSGDSIPENLLRFEVKFDAPLRAPLDMRHVTLLDASGTPIRDALLDIPLSSRDASRTSILLHPGRVKSGVGPNLALGMALRQGEKVELLIDDPQLPEPARKSWVVGAPVRENIDLNKWLVQSPAPATREPLRIIFPAAVDAGALQMIAVAAPDGKRLRGEASFMSAESGWEFVPASPWHAGRYQIRVHPDIEDPQGNRLCSAFEQRQQSREACREEGRLDFTVGRQ